MQRVLLAIGVGIVCPYVLLGQNDSVGRTEELVRRCEGNASVKEQERETVVENAVLLGYCSGFFAGILSASPLAERLTGKPLFCLPKDGISIDQSIKIFLKFAQDHPQELHQSARIIVAVSLSLAFPCKK